MFMRLGNAELDKGANVRLRAGVRLPRLRPARSRRRWLLVEPAGYSLQLQAGGGCDGYQQGGTQPQQGGFGGCGKDVADGWGGHAALPQGVSRESCPPLHTPTVLPMGLFHGSDLTSAL